MTGKELAKLIGRTARFTYGGLAIRMSIIDAKMVWGSVQVQITPAEGSGSLWVRLESVTLDSLAEVA